MTSQNNSKTNSPQKLRQFPHSIEAEEEIISAALLGAANEVLKLLKPGDFYRTGHQIIFKTISDLYAEGHPVAPTGVVDRLQSIGRLDEVGGASFVAHLVDSVPSARSVEWAAGRILETSARRRMIQVGNDVVKLAYDEPEFGVLQDRARQAFRELDTPAGGSSTFFSYEDLADSELERWEAIGQKPSGVPSGFEKIDRLTGGFQPTDLIVLAARPGMGKTALMLCIAENAARQGYPVAIFSLEMSRSQLYGRQTARVARVNSQKFRVGGIQPEEWIRIAQAQEDLSGLPVFIDDSPRQRISELLRRARWAADRLGVRMIVIDYLQLIKGDSRQQRKDLEIGDITGDLKGLAKEANLPVVLLSQLNRQVETRDNKRPKLSDLRESGAIEQDADIVSFLYVDEYYTKDVCKCPGVAELDFAKHRAGITGPVFLTWIAWRQSFENQHGVTA